MGENNLSLNSNIVGTGQAADKNKQTKRKVGHTKQTKKEIISKQTKAKKDRTDHNHHENWSTSYVIIMRTKQRRNKSTWQNLKWQLYIRHFPTIFLNNNNYYYWLIKHCLALILCLSQLLIINGRTI